MSSHRCNPANECEACEIRAEQIKEALDDELTAAEEAALDDAYERRYGRY